MVFTRRSDRYLAEGVALLPIILERRPYFDPLRLTAAGSFTRYFSLSDTRLRVYKH